MTNSNKLPKGIYQRRDCFYANYLDDLGRRVRKSLGSNLQEAIRTLAEMRQHEKEPTPKGAVNLPLLVNSYMRRLSVYGKPRSVDHAHLVCGRLEKFFATHPLTRVGLDAFITSRRRGLVKDSTINGDLAILRAVINHALDEELIKERPVKIRLLKVNRKRELPILGKEEILRLLSNAEGCYYGIILIAATTGMRCDEILHLTWGDVFEREGRVTITSKDGWSTKSHQERSTYVTKSVLSWLAGHRLKSRFREQRDYIFATRTRRPITPSNCARQVRKSFQSAGLYQKGRPLLHLLRHSAASNLLGAGLDLETVRQQLGHADISTTALYVRTTDERMKRVSELLEVI